MAVPNSLGSVASTNVTLAITRAQSVVQSATSPVAIGIAPAGTGQMNILFSAPPPGSPVRSRPVPTLFNGQPSEPFLPARAPINLPTPAPVNTSPATIASNTDNKLLRRLKTEKGRFHSHRLGQHIICALCNYPAADIAPVPDDRLGVDCKLKFPAAVGHETVTVVASTRLMLKTGWVGGAPVAVICRLKTLAP